MYYIVTHTHNKYGYYSVAYEVRSRSVTNCVTIVFRAPNGPAKLKDCGPGLSA